MQIKSIWTCKIGYAERSILPSGSDRPMGLAVERVFYELTGKREDFCFSGWGGELSEYELSVVEDRIPKISNITLEIINQLEQVISGYNKNHVDEINKIMYSLKYIAMMEKLNDN